MHMQYVCTKQTKIATFLLASLFIYRQPNEYRTVKLVWIMFMHRDRWPSYKIYTQTLYMKLKVENWYVSRVVDEIKFSTIFVVLFRTVRRKYEGSFRQSVVLVCKMRIYSNIRNKIYFHIKVIYFKIVHYLEVEKI